MRATPFVVALVLVLVAAPAVAHHRPNHGPGGTTSPPSSSIIIEAPFYPAPPWVDCWPRLHQDVNVECRVLSDAHNDEQGNLEASTQGGPECRPQWYGFTYECMSGEYAELEVRGFNSTTDAFAPRLARFTVEQRTVDLRAENAHAAANLELVVSVDGCCSGTRSVELSADSPRGIVVYEVPISSSWGATTSTGTRFHASLGLSASSHYLFNGALGSASTNVDVQLIEVVIT